jgi:hypothetical protein
MLPAAGGRSYDAGVKFGDELMLPAAGNRSNGDGALFSRGYFGLYWSSTEYDSSGAWNLGFGSSDAGMYYYFRAGGLSVRCVAE